MAEKPIRVTGITASEEQLNNLFRETLDGIRDDIQESQENADMYKELMGNDGGREAYGVQYNDALKIKALARTRQLQFLNMFKDRVGKKEQLELATAGNKKEDNLDITQLNNLIDDIQKGKKFENVAPVVAPPKVDAQPPKKEDDDVDYEEEIDLDYTGEDDDE